LTYDASTLPVLESGRERIKTLCAHQLKKETFAVF
jgi:hypothetical protein